MQGLCNYLCGGSEDVLAKVSCTCAGDTNVPLQSTFYLRVVGSKYGPHPSWPEEINGLLVPPGKAYTQLINHLITGLPFMSEPA